MPSKLRILFALGSVMGPVLLTYLLFPPGNQQGEEARLWEPKGARYISRPVFSGDGQRIVYTALPPREKKRDIFVSLADGTEERNLSQHPANESDPMWSPDGRFLYFLSDREGHGEIYRMLPDGSGLQNISKNPADEGLFDLSPDGSKIVFERRDPRAYQDVALIIASADGADQRFLVKGGWRPQWSPDGQWILHSRVGDETGAWIIRPDGSGERRIELDKHFGRPLVWMPDSKGFLAFVRGARCKEGLCVYDIYLVNLEGTERKLALQDMWVVEDVWVRPLSLRCSWDYANTRFAMALNCLDIVDGGVERNGIVILDRLGNIVSDFRSTKCKHKYFDLCWSPKGNSFLFVKLPRFGESTGGIYTMNDDGTDERQLVPDNVVWASGPGNIERFDTRVEDKRKQDK